MRHSRPNSGITALRAAGASAPTPPTVPDPTANGTEPGPGIDTVVSLQTAPSDVRPGLGAPTADSFTLLRAGPTTGASAVTWAITGGAVPVTGADFVGGVLPSGTASFAAGGTLVTVPFQVAAESLLADRNAVLTLTGATGAVLGGVLTAAFNLTAAAAQATMQLTLPPGDVTPTLAAAVAIVCDVVRTGSTGVASSFDWAVQAGAAPAVQGTDFQAGVLPSGTLSFAIGDTFKQLTITVKAKAPPTATRNANLHLSNPLGGRIFGGTDYPFRLLQAASNNSGLAWLSGSNPTGDANVGSGAFPANMTTFDTNVRGGRKQDVLNMKSNGVAPTGWVALENSIRDHADEYAACAAIYARKGVVVQQVLDYIPATAPGGSKATPNLSCANGDYDAHYATIAAYLNGYYTTNAIPGPLILRLGHELNGTFAYGPRSTSTTAENAAYKAAFHHVALYFKQNITAVKVLVDWNWLRESKGVNVDNVYPGDDAVDIIGSDCYHNTFTSPVTTDAEFNTYARKVDASGFPMGPEAWILYARGRGKKCGFAEWGVTNPGGPTSPMDSAAYIRGMHNLFNTYSSTVLYECYFNVLDAGTGDHRLLALNNPASTAEYRRLWT